jgi:two-component system cell cycle sensor histidine kinase/response regulator CckA
VIEDEPGLREFMVDVLKRNGYGVVIAKDGPEAIRQFDARRKEIALVLSDMDLPKLDGEKVLTALKVLDPLVKVILASGYLEPQLKAHLLKSGAKVFCKNRTARNRC